MLVKIRRFLTSNSLSSEPGVFRSIPCHCLVQSVHVVVLNPGCGEAVGEHDPGLPRKAAVPYSSEFELRVLFIQSPLQLIVS